MQQLVIVPGLFPVNNFHITQRQKGKDIWRNHGEFFWLWTEKAIQERTFWLEVSSTSQSALWKRFHFLEYGKKRTFVETAGIICPTRTVCRGTWKVKLTLIQSTGYWIKSPGRRCSSSGRSLMIIKKERMWILPPITTIIQPVAFGGARLKLSENATEKTYSNRKTLNWDADISYGFRNHDINGSVGLQRKYNPFNSGQFGIRAGRNFEFIYPGDAWVNVLKRSNIYLNTSLEATHELQIINVCIFRINLRLPFAVQLPILK